MYVGGSEARRARALCKNSNIKGASFFCACWGRMEVPLPPSAVWGVYARVRHPKAAFATASSDVPRRVSCFGPEPAAVLPARPPADQRGRGRWHQRLGNEEVDGGGGSRASWGKNVPYAEYPCPDCHIERDLGDDPPVPVTVSDGDRSAPRGPECQAWQCSAEGAGQPVMYCMRTAAHDAWYPAGKGKDKYVFYTNNPMVWRRDWFARCREVGRGAAYRGFEPTIQASAEWNKLPGYVIARGMGLFQHKRLDRGKDPVQLACRPCGCAQRPGGAPGETYCNRKNAEGVSQPCCKECTSVDHGSYGGECHNTHSK